MKKNWNDIWKQNTYLTNFYPNNNIIYFYKYHLSKLKKKTKILDCGCGNGNNYIFLAEKGFEVYGTDAAESIINLNKIRFKKFKKNFICGDIRKIKFNNNYFDAIISDGSLYYQNIENIRQTVDKFYDLLKKNGIIRVYTKSINDNFFRNFNKKKSVEYKVKIRHWEKGLTLSFLTLKDIKKIFGKFKSLKIGIDEFNFINFKKKHSFYVITAKK